MARPKTNDFPLYMCRDGKRFIVRNPINKRVKRFRDEEQARKVAAVLARYLRLLRPRKQRRRKPKSRTRSWQRRYCDARRRAIKRATPPWVDRAAIRAIYTQARMLSLTTGIPHSVDHDIPLRGKHVCGLHVVGNLKIIRLDDNTKKGNKFQGT